MTSQAEDFRRFLRHLLSFSLETKRLPSQTFPLNSKSVLDARDERGFVDLSQIHKLVAPVDRRCPLRYT